MTIKPHGKRADLNNILSNWDDDSPDVPVVHGNDNDDILDGWDDTPVSPMDNVTVSSSRKSRPKRNKPSTTRKRANSKRNTKPSNDAKPIEDKSSDTIPDSITPVHVDSDDIQDTSIIPEPDDVITPLDETQDYDNYQVESYESDSIQYDDTQGTINEDTNYPVVQDDTNDVPFIEDVTDDYDANHDVSMDDTPILYDEEPAQYGTSVEQFPYDDTSRMDDDGNEDIISVLDDNDEEQYYHDIVASDDNVDSTPLVSPDDEGSPFIEDNEDTDDLLADDTPVVSDSSSDSIPVRNTHSGRVTITAESTINRVGNEDAVANLMDDDWFDDDYSMVEALRREDIRNGVTDATWMTNTRHGIVYDLPDGDIPMPDMNVQDAKYVVQHPEPVINDSLGDEDLPYDDNVATDEDSNQSQYTEDDYFQSEVVDDRDDTGAYDAHSDSSQSVIPSYRADYDEEYAQPNTVTELNDEGYTDTYADGNGQYDTNETLDSDYDEQGYTDEDDESYSEYPDNDGYSEEDDDSTESYDNTQYYDDNDAFAEPTDEDDGEEPIHDVVALGKAFADSMGDDYNDIIRVDGDPAYDDTEDVKEPASDAIPVGNDGTLTGTQETGAHDSPKLNKNKDEHKAKKDNPKRGDFKAVFNTFMAQVKSELNGGDDEKPSSGTDNHEPKMNPKKIGHGKKAAHDKPQNDTPKQKLSLKGILDVLKNPKKLLSTIKTAIRQVKKTTVIVLAIMVILVSVWGSSNIPAIINKGSTAEASPDEGSVKITGTSWHDDTAWVSVENNSDMIAYVTGKAQVRSWAPSLNPTTWLTAQLNAECTVPSTEVDPGSSKDIKAECKTKPSGTWHRVRAELQYE